MIDGTDFPSLVGLCLTLGQILKVAICGKSADLRDRFGRLIVVGVSLAIVTVYVLTEGTPVYHQLLTAYLAALTSMGLYQGGNALVRAQRPARRSVKPEVRDAAS